MKSTSPFVGIGLALGAGFAAALTAVTHRPEMGIPLGIGIGLAIGVGIRDRKAGRPAIRQVCHPERSEGSMHSQPNAQILPGLKAVQDAKS